MINMIGKSNFIYERTKKNKIVIIALILNTLFGLGQNAARAQSQSVINHVQEQANLMGQAYLKGDYHTFAKYTYTTIVSSMGGETRMAAVLASSIAEIKAQGMTLSSITYDCPTTVIKSGNELQCTLQQHTSIKLANGHAVTTSTLIAISNDGGKNWTFVDTNNKTTIMMKKALPNLSSAILIPPQQKPVFYNF